MERDACEITSLTSLNSSNDNASIRVSDAKNKNRTPQPNALVLWWDFFHIILLG
jgi:hypothetical protein